MYIKVASKDDANKLSELLKDGDWMVLYYAEWCGHCNNMKPEWRKVVDKMSKSKNVNVADVESSHIGELAEQPKVEGFPTIKMYNNGKEVANFQDERVADKMEKFALSNSRNVKRKTVAAPVMKLNNIKINNEVKNEVGVVKADDIKDVKAEEMKAATFKLPSIFKKTTKAPTKAATKAPTKPKTRKPSIKAIVKEPTHKQSLKKSPSDLPCDKIIKSKVCKFNPKCKYDYVESKCKFKSSRKSLPTRKNFKKLSLIKTSKKKSNKGIREQTTDVFKELIKSFKRIGNEAEKDAQLLKRATKKI